MPKKKSSSDGEYSSAISRFLPNSDDRTSEPSPSSSKSRKQESEIVLNDDRHKEESSGRAADASPEQEAIEGNVSVERPSDRAPLAEDSPERAKVRLTAPYVDEAVSHVFEESWLKLRRMTGEKVSQSEVIEAALAIACDEFTREEKESALYQAIESIRSEA